MSCTDFAHPVATATRPEDSTVFVALELSRKSWLVATSSPGEDRVSKRVVVAGDGPGLLALLGKLRETAERRLGRAVRGVVIQAHGTAPAVAPGGSAARGAWEAAPAEPAALLMRLKGIGPEFAALLWLEALFR